MLFKWIFFKENFLVGNICDSAYVLKAILRVVGRKSMFRKQLDTSPNRPCAGRSYARPRPLGAGPLGAGPWAQALGRRPFGRGPWAASVAMCM